MSQLDDIFDTYFIGPSLEIAKQQIKDLILLELVGDHESCVQVSELRQKVNEL